MQANGHRLVLCAALASAMLASLTACSSADDELEQFIADTKKQPGGRVQPLPEVKPYEQFIYNSAGRRSPFVQAGPASDSGSNASPERSGMTWDRSRIVPSAATSPGFSFFGGP